MIPFIFFFLLTHGTISLSARENIFFISHLEEPTLFQATLPCQYYAQVTIGLAPRPQNETFMLRLDYQPNKCIQAPQDTLIDREDTQISIIFQKTCCSLATTDGAEKVRIVATLRYAYSMFGFPVSRKFIWSIIPVLIITILGVCLSVVFIGPAYNERKVNDRAKDKTK